MTNHPNRSRYALECNPHYFSGDIFRRDRSYLVRGHDERVVVLGSQEDAETVRKLLDFWGGGPYQLGHNQYSRPSHEIVRYRGKEPALDVIRAARTLGYGYGDEGEVLNTDQLRAKVSRMVDEQQLDRLTN